MKISLLTIFLFMSAASLTSVSARVWKEYENGQVLWDDNCHCVGYDIGQVELINVEDCVTQIGAAGLRALTSLTPTECVTLRETRTDGKK